MFPRAASNLAAQDERSVSQTFDRALVVQQLIEGEQSRGRNQGSRPYGLQWPHYHAEDTHINRSSSQRRVGRQHQSTRRDGDGDGSCVRAWRSTTASPPAPNGALNCCRLPWLLRTLLHGAIAIYIDTGRVRCFSCHLMVPLPTAVCPLPPCNRCCATRAVEREEGAANWRD